MSNDVVRDCALFVDGLFFKLFLQNISITDLSPTPEMPSFTTTKICIVRFDSFFGLVKLFHSLSDNFLNEMFKNKRF